MFNLSQIGLGTGLHYGDEAERLSDRSQGSSQRAGQEQNGSGMSHGMNSLDAPAIAPIADWAQPGSGPDLALCWTGSRVSA